MNKILTLIKRWNGNAKLKKICFWAIATSLFLYIFSIPSFSGREDKTHFIAYLFMALLGASTVFYFVVFEKPKINKLMFIIFSFVIFSFFGTAIYSRVFEKWRTLILMFVAMLIIYYAFVAINNVRLSMRILVVAFLLFSIYFVVHYRNIFLNFKNIDLSFLRVGSDNFFDNINTIGFYFSIGFALSFYLALMFKKRIELLFFLPMVIFFVLGMLTGSRSFIMTVAVGILFVLFIKLRHKKILFVAVAAGLVGLFFVIINIPTFSFLKEQFNRTISTLFGIGEAKTDTSTVQRVVWPQYGWYLGGKNMLIGYGCDGFKVFSGVETYSHNNYSEVACNFGVVGFILYFSAFITPLFFVYKSKDKDVYIVPVLISMYLIRNFFGVTYYSKDSYLVLALCYYLTRDCKLSFYKQKHSLFGRTTEDYAEVYI